MTEDELAQQQQYLLFEAAVGHGRLIELTRGLVTLVDEDTFQLWGHLNWYADPKPDFYAMRAFPHLEKGQQKVALHNLIMPLKEGFYADHRKGNTLDNRREHLRYATKSQNTSNRRKKKGKDLPLGVFRDVNYYRDKEYRYFRAQCRGVFLGHFPSVEAASAAYHEEAVKCYGEFARDENLCLSN